jgi:hypothetical protein
VHRPARPGATRTGPGPQRKAPRWGALLNHAAERLTGIDAPDPIAEIYAYMQAYPILPILDNLENVLDDKTRKFLAGIPAGAKVIITSRFGLQAMDLGRAAGRVGMTPAAWLVR